VNRFDTASNQWLMNGADAPIQRMGGCVAYNGSHFVMIDGQSDTNQSTQYVYIQFYDIERDVWSMHTVEAPFDATGLPRIAWRYQYCAFADDKLYIFGGKIGVSTYLNGMWRYDTLNQQFTSIGTLPLPCAYGTTASDGFGHLYLLGCWSRALQYTNQIFVFDTSTESIATDIIYGKIALSEPGVVIFNRTLWIFGGEFTALEITSAKIQICDISSFLPTTKSPTAEPSAETIQTTATPSASPSSGKNGATIMPLDLLLSILIVVAACGCFCVALFFFLRSQKKRSHQQEMQQPKNDIVPAQPGSMHVSSQPAIPIHRQPVVHMQPYPFFPSPPNAVPQPVPVAPVHQPNPPNAREEPFVYDENMNYKKEGVRASVITPVSNPHTVDEEKSDDESDDDDDEMYVLNNHQITSTQQTNTAQSDHDIAKDNDTQDRNAKTLFM